MKTAGSMVQRWALGAQQVLLVLAFVASCSAQGDIDAKGKYHDNPVSRSFALLHQID